MNDHSEVPPFDESFVPDDADWMSSSNEPVIDEPVTPPRPATNLVTVTPFEALHSLRQVVASQHGATPESALEFLTHVSSSSDRVLSVAGGEHASTYVGVFECLKAECANRSGGRIQLDHLGLARLYDADVQAELRAIADAVDTLDDVILADPFAVWGALSERIQRMRAASSAGGYITKIKTKQTLEELMESYRNIEPPTNRQAVVKRGGLPTAKSVHQNKVASMAGQPTIRLSSGFPTLDYAVSGSRGAKGLVALGEGVVIAAATGSGKSSFAYTLVPALVQDVRNWGFEDGKVLFFHTEEESEDKMDAMEFLPGQKFHHLADNLIIDAIGTSRTKIVEIIYDVVIEAQRRCSETGRPITDFLPYALVLDYIQSVQEKGEDPVTSSAATSSLLFRGIQAWNPEEMSKFGGVDFRTYAGFAWPSGMDHHRVGCVSFAQLVKQNDDDLFYKAAKRGVSLSDFTLEDGRPKPGWVAPDGSPWCWEVEEGDARILRKNSIRGSGLITQDATTIMFLHRSRPVNNPAEGPDGAKSLQDVRAHLILDKTRTGSSVAYVPMDFNVDARAFRARFYDRLAEQALEEGRFSVDGAFAQPGDPMLPVRQHVSPLAGFRY
jgi:hypothetical protein